MLLAALSVTGLASASNFATPLGSHLLVRTATDVQISSKLFIFNASLPYWMEGPIAPRTFCTVTDPNLISCPVNETRAGDIVYHVGENVSSILHTMFIHTYSQPTVSNLSVTELPTSGGTMFTVSFAGSGLVETDGVARFDNIKTRFVKACCIADPARCCNVLGEVAMDLTDRTFGSVRSRSPSLGVAVGTQVELYLAVNGRSFLPTGRVVTVVAKSKLKIGFIYVSDPSDFGWTFQHNLARLSLEERFVGQIETTTAEHVEEWGMNECTFCKSEPGWNPNANRGVGSWSDEAPELYGTHRAANVVKRWVEDEGVTMVVGASFYYQVDLFHMAAKYPQVFFVHTGGWLTRPNMAVVFPKVLQARYLSGIALGWYIKKHNLPKKIGFASAFPLGETVRAINALKLGLEKVDPEIDIYLTWMLNWFNPRKEDLVARRLMRFYGVSAIAQHTDSRAPQLAAKDEGIIGCGYNTDMLLTVGDSVLTSPILVWGNMYADLVQKVLDGNQREFESNTWSGFEGGSTKLSTFSPRVPTEARIMIAAEQAKLERGEDTIFCKPNMTDNKGRLRNGPTNPAINPVPWEAQHLRGPGSTCLTNNVINQVCAKYDGFNCKEHWLLAGIHDHCGPSLRMPSGIQSPGLPAGTCFLGPLDLPDVCPPGEFLEIKGCKKVRAGYYQRDEKEFPCAPGYFANAEGMEACKPCPSGFFSDAPGAVECTACAPGNYANTAALSQCALCGPGLFSDKKAATQCSFCLQGTYSESEGTSHCTVCPTAMTTPNIASHSRTMCVCAEGFFGEDYVASCTKCPASSRTEGIDSKDKAACLCDKDTYMNKDGAACLPCPGTMTCPRGSSFTNFALHLGKAKDDVYKQYPLLKERYWSSVADPMSVFDCESKDQCVGGDPGDAACASGLQGQACAHCTEGSIWDGKECKACSNVEATALVFPIVPVLIAPPILSGMYFLFGDGYAKWGSWRNGLSSSAFILLNFYQISALFGDLNLVLPRSNVDLFGFFTFGSDVATIFRPGCAGVRDFQGITIVKAVVPLWLIVMALITFVLSQICSKIAKRPGMDKNRLMNVVLSLILTFFAGICQMCFQLFKCAANPNGIKTLTADRSVNCYEADWNGSVGVAVVAIIVWCLGFGLLFGWVIFTSPTYFHETSFQVRWKFLFIKYRPDVHWWSLLFVAKGIFLNIGFLIFVSGVGQIYWMMAVLSVYLCASICFTPWRHLWVNVLDIWAHACLILTLSSLVWFAAMDASYDDKDRLNRNMSNFTMTCSFLILPCIVPVLGYMIWWSQSSTAHNKRKRLAEDFHMICVHIATILEEGEKMGARCTLNNVMDFTSWVHSLSDRDVTYLMKAREVLGQELLHVKARPGYAPRGSKASSIKEVVLSSQSLRSLPLPTENVGPVLVNV